MSSPSETPKETTSQEWSAAVATQSAALDQLDQSDSRMGETPEQGSSCGVQALPAAADPSPAPPSTPVAMATSSLPQQPAAHFQMVSQMVSGVTTPTVQVSAQQSQQSLQLATGSQAMAQQTFHHLTAAQGASHQTVQYGATPSMMTQTAEQQTMHLQTTQAVMTHGTGQQTIQLGLSQGLLTHGMGQQTIQGLMAQGSSVFGGTQIICSSDPSSNAQMDSATVACQQYLTSPGLTGTQFMPVPQLQVIQTAPNQLFQQQIMYQNMSLPTAVHAVQNQSVGQQITQGRPNSVDSKNASILPAAQQQNVAIRIALTNSYTLPTQTGATKGMATVVPQSANIFNGKQVTQKPQASPLVFGVQQMQQPTILQSMRPAGGGSISFSPVQPAQIISNPTQFRFATAPNFISNTAQMIGPNQTLVNLGQFQTVPIVQPLLATQGTTILGSQPLYIRTADTVQPQQQSILGSVQTVTPTRHVANIAPQTIRPTTTVQSRRGAQVQPNNTSATHSQTSTLASKSSSASLPQKSSAKLPTLAKMTSVTKPAATTSSVTAASRPPSQSATIPRIGISGGTPIATVTAQSKPQVNCKAEDAGKMEEKLNPTTKQDNTAMEVMEKSTTSNTPLKEEMVSPSAKSVAAVLPTSVEKQLSEVKINSDEAVKNVEEKAVNVKLVAEKENKPNAKPVREKAPKKPKPRVLTHIIEGFIIQEAMEPFPVNRSSLMSQFLSPSLSIPDEKNTLSFASQFDDDSEDEDVKEPEEDEESPSKRSRTDPETVEEVTVEKTAVIASEAQQTVEMPPTPVIQDSPLIQNCPRLTCEFCGKSDEIKNFARSKRFCSVTCSKRFSAYSQRKQSEKSEANKLQRRLSHPLPIACTGNDMKTMSGTPSTGPLVGVGGPGLVVAPFHMSHTIEYSSDSGRSTSALGRLGESSTPCSPPELERVEHMDTDEFGDVQIPANKHLSQWGVQDVYNFIRTLPGCGMYADEFRQQEIDGQALMLLKEDHLMTTLNVKLGPALKICAKINKLKD